MESTGADIIERIDKALEVKKASRKDLYISLGLAFNTLSNWDKRGTIPSADIALKIANYLGISVQWLITGKDDQGLTLEERNLLVKYRSLDGRGRYEVDALLDAKLKGNIGEMDGEKEALA
jgi:transcriptional regulator with XRE-family HTH domain